MKKPVLKLAASEGAKASNLALALAALPLDRRRDALTFYAFCREVDDIADEPTRSLEEKRATFTAWKQALETNQGIPLELEAVIKRRGLQEDLLIEIVRGMEMDIDPPRYASYEELQAYCWRAAGAVGLVSARLFGCQRPESERYAEELGYALQLTNILRDVAEDAKLGRIYLPSDDLRQFGVTEASLLVGSPEGDFLGLMAYETARTRAHYARAKAALPSEDKAALVAAEIMRRTYEKLLDRMEADGFQVFRRRYRLSKWEKLWILTTGTVRNWFAKV